MISAVIIDNDEDALDLLENLLKQIGGVRIVGRYINPLQALEDLNQLSLKEVNAVFLANQMPGMIGIDLAKKIKEATPSMPVVFTTAYAEYAIEAFEIRATDYLLKPITKERLEKTIMRITSLNANKNQKC